MSELHGVICKCISIFLKVDLSSITSDWPNNKREVFFTVDGRREEGQGDHTPRDYARVLPGWISILLK